MNRVDIVIPVYNEKENFEAAYALLKTQVHSDWRALLIYDFEEDSTLISAKPIAARDRRVILVRNEGSGVLDAMKTGFSYAAAEAVLMLMVDDNPEIFEKIDTLVNAFYNANAAIAVPSRYMRGGSHTNGPVIKSLLSRAAGVSLYYLVGLPTHDATYATRLYRKSFLKRTPVESEKGFELALELTLKAYFNGETVIEIPVSWKERTIGKSRFNMRKWLPAYLRWYLWGIRMRYLSAKKSPNALST